MNARAALDAVYDYLSAKDALAVDVEHLGESSADPVLNAIAERFQAAISQE